MGHEQWKSTRIKQDEAEGDNVILGAEIGPEPRKTASSRYNGPEPRKTGVEPRDTSVELRMCTDSALDTQTQLLFRLLQPSNFS